MTLLQNLISSKILQAEWEALKLAIPILCLTLLSSGSSSVTLLFAGRLGDDVLDGVGLATTLYSTVVFAFVIGYSNVFDTYGPQVYGSTHKKNLSAVAVKCAFQALLIYLILLGPYLNAVYIIDALPDDEKSVGDGSAFKDVAKDYFRMTCLCGYLYYLIKIIGNYLAIQKQTKFVYVIAATSFSSHLLLNYVLVEWMSLGTTGLALALIGSNLTTLAVLVGICYVMIRKGILVWGGISEGIFENWLPMIKLGLSGFVSIMSEIGFLQAAVFFSQFDGSTVLSTILIQFRVISIGFSPALGVGYAAAVLIGKALSKGDLNEIKLHIKLTIFNVILESLILIILFYLAKRAIAVLFTDDEDVINMVNDTMWWLCLQLPFDHLQCVLARGILVAFGKQRFIAITMGVLASCVGIPIIVMTVFLTDLEIAGLFISYLCFGILQSVALAVRIRKINLHDEVSMAMIRVKESAVDNKEGSHPASEELGTVNLAYNGKDESVVRREGANDEGKGNRRENGLVEISSPTYSKDKKIILLTLLVSTVSCVVLGLTSVMKN